MARLTGTLLKVARMLTDTPPGRAIAGRQMRATYGVDRWDELPAAARDGFETNDRPVPGAAPRQWGNDGLDVPESDGTTSRRLRRAFESGEVTPVELLEEIRQRIGDAEFGESKHSPFVRHDWERAFDQAEASAERWANGEPLSPLDGVPVPIKDHHRQQGVPTSNGTAFFAEQEGPDERDSEVVRRLADAGAILVGKSLVTEWGMQPTGFSPHFQMPRNVHDSDHAAGGSSTGTAVAVGLGLAPVGLGSDGGGSIRIPSALNGLYGIKPTYQRLSRDGDYWGRSTLGHSGPIGQSTSDLVDFLTVTGGESHAADSATVPPAQIDGGEATGPEEWRDALGRGVEGADIGVWSWAMEAADPAIADPVWNALERLESEGATLREVEIPFGAEHVGIGTMTFAAEFLGLLGPTIEENVRATGDDVRLVFNVFESVDIEEYMQSRQMRDVLRRNLAETIRSVDVLAMPTTGMTAPEYSSDQTGRAVYDEEAIEHLCQFAFLANLTGLPAGTAPCGWVGGLPVGIQFVGDAWDEASVFAMLAGCERAGLAGDRGGT